MKLLVCALPFLLIGCTDRGKCLESKTELILIMQTVLVGQTITMIPQFLPVETCLKWEYPEGRK